VLPDHPAEDTQTITETLALARNTGDLEAGLRHFMAERPTQLDQYGHPTFRKELIRLLLAEERIEEARAVMPGADDPGPSDWHHVLFARALKKVGRNDEARAHWEACLAANPRHPEAVAALRRADAKPAESGTISVPSEIDPAAPLLPRMSEAERLMFRRALDGVENFLEFGAGGSTAVAANAGVKRIVSVESDKEWLDMLAKRPEIAALDYTPFFIDIGPTGNWGVPTDRSTAPKWPAYYQSVWKTLPWQPDIVLVDGRFRVACALASLLNCAPGTRILIHDFWNRRHYHVVLKYLATVERVDSLGMFRAKPDIDKNDLLADLAAHAEDPR
jgi:hypothetical protein